MPLNATLTPTQTDVLTALRSFLVDVLPAGTPVVQGVANRVPQPSPPNAVVMTPIRYERLATNIDGSADVAFTASIAPQTANFTGSIAPAPPVVGVAPSGILTVSAVGSGQIVIGALIASADADPTTVVLSQISGSAGGTGTYAVNVSQTVASEAMTQAWGLMTVSAVETGPIVPNAVLFGTGVTVPTFVTQQLSGSTGSTGTYVVTPSQTISSALLASGATTIQQNSRITVQLDFHSIDGSSSDMAQTVSAAFRDAYATTFFAALSTGSSIAPFYADDPKLLPFQNENSQYEWRWVSEATLQVNQTLSTPQQYSDVLSLTLIDVDARFPPS